MPCDCSHLTADKYERESKEVAKHLVYVYKELNKEIPEWIKGISNNYYGAPEKIHRLTALLCSHCRSMSKEEVDRIIYNAHNKDSRKLADWWEHHVEIDERKRLSRVISFFN